MTSRSTLTPIQAAVYSKLTGDATLMALVEGVYDHVPEGAERPYVSFGFAISTPENAHDRFGTSTVLTLDVWSEYHGWSEANQIDDRVKALLDHQSITVTGHTAVAVRHELSLQIRDPDPEIRHVQARYRFTTEQSPN